MQLNPLLAHRIFHKLGLALVLTTLVASLAPPVLAQGLFSPAIRVNDDAITNYELQQRSLFLTILRAPGDPEELAREALIDDRLRQQETRAAGIEVSAEDVEAGINEFAARTQLSGAEFLKALAQEGVAPETVRDFTRVSLEWRELIRSRFLQRARPTDAEISRALGQDGSGGGVRVLLSEIIIPVTPQNQDQAQDLAAQIAQVKSYGAFSEAASRYSASDTRTNGGRMNWLPINNLPPPLRPVILELSPGDVTAPITLPNAIALFQMRGIQEIVTGTPRYSAIEYATYAIPGGRSAEALSRAAAIANRVDTCDDLYGIAKGQPPEVLDRLSLPPGQIPRDIALELAKLDDNEVSTTLTASNGQTLVFLMLCGRTAALNENASREEVANALAQQRLAAFSESLLDQLRADARIVEQ